MVHHDALGVEYIIKESLVVEYIARGLRCFGGRESSTEVMGINDLAQLRGSSLHLSDLILEEAVQATYAEATFSLVKLVVEGTDMPEVIAVIENTNACQACLFFFCVHCQSIYLVINANCATKLLFLAGSINTYLRTPSRHVLIASDCFAEDGALGRGGKASLGRVIYINVRAREKVIRLCWNAVGAVVEGGTIVRWVLDDVLWNVLCTTIASGVKQ